MNTAKRTIDNVLSDLNPRQKEVIMGRFGLLENQEPQTLAAIGNKYGLTRERIRQIEASSLKALKEKITGNSECQNMLGKGKKYLQTTGGIAREDNLLTHLASTADGLTRNHLSFLLEATGAFHSYNEDKDFWPFYFGDKEKLSQANKFTSQLVKFLKTQKTAILDGNYSNLVKEFVDSAKINEAHAKNYLSVSKKIHTNPFGDTGLSEWPEIKPQNIRDRIYLVLKKTGKPLHFETITQEINRVNFDNRPALAPTVHNELIKDSRFVLVGRGIYGLSEAGYKPGTVQEVIKRILKENGPLNTKEISLAIEKERILKPNTILVNLQNRKVFERLNDGAYRIRQD
ncbi:MAG: sigma factor-like helix-turn-helix DNA-binding protein [Patescibacteria group bacterium]